MSLLKTWMLGRQIKAGLRQSNQDNKPQSEKPQADGKGDDLLKKVLAFSLLGFIGYKVYAKSRANSSVGFAMADELSGRINSAFAFWGTNEDELYKVAFEIPDEATWKAVQDAYFRDYGEALKAKLSDELDATELNLFNRYLKDKSKTPEIVAKDKGYASVKDYNSANETKAILSLNEWSTNRKAFILPTATKPAPEQLVYPRFLMLLPAWADATLKYRYNIKAVSYRDFGKIVFFRKNAQGVYDLIKVQITNKAMPEYGQSYWFLPSGFTAAPPPPGFSGSLSGLLI